MIRLVITEREQRREQTQEEKEARKLDHPSHHVTHSEKRDTKTDHTPGIQRGVLEPTAVAEERIQLYNNILKRSQTQ
jgi:hypothetical protein